jgi:hypothetical protein
MYGVRVDDLVVWLATDHTDRTSAPPRDAVPTGMLCRKHADAMVVPRGWWLDDRRYAQPRLFRPADVPFAEPSIEASRQRHPAGPRRRTSGPPPAPNLFELVPGEQTVAEMASVAPVPDDDAATRSNADDTTALPWRPVFDTDDDLDGLLDASTPLLGRAFKGDRARDEP